MKNFYLENRKENSMTDQEILKELLDQREWWEKVVDKEQKKLDEFKAELAKTNRLIELLELKIKVD